MDYEKKYKEALERMKSWAKGEHPECFSEAQKAAEFIFPEPKESEDNRIVRCLLNYFNHIRYNGLDLQGTDVDEVIAWLEKQSEQPTDKVETKFKVGDWITSGGYTWKIVEVKPLDYILQSQDGNIVDDTISYVDEHFHLWTIADAKDGDILAVDPIDSYQFPFVAIYKERGLDFFNSYCFISFDGKFYEADEGHSTEEIHPATKGQRDLLFQKMKEAGYEWDANKKELKKIEPKKASVNKVIEWINSDKVIEWLKCTVRKTSKNYGVYKETHLTLPYNSIEDLINDFKEDFELC